MPPSLALRYGRHVAPLKLAGLAPRQDGLLPAIGGDYARAIAPDPPLRHAWWLRRGRERGEHPPKLRGRFPNHIWVHFRPSCQHILVAFPIFPSGFTVEQFATQQRERWFRRFVASALEDVLEGSIVRYHPELPF